MSVPNVASAITPALPVGPTPNYQPFWACSPRSNLFGLKPNYEPFGLKPNYEPFGLKPNYEHGGPTPNYKR